MARTTNKGILLNDILHGEERAIPMAFRSLLKQTKQPVPRDTPGVTRAFGCVKNWIEQTVTAEANQTILLLDALAWPTLHDTEFDAETGVTIDVTKTIVASGTVTGGVATVSNKKVVTEVQALDEVHDLILTSSPNISVSGGLTLVSGGVADWSGPAETPTMDFYGFATTVTSGFVGSKYQMESNALAINAATKFTERRGAFPAKITTLYAPVQSSLANIKTLAGVSTSPLMLTIGNSETLGKFENYLTLHASIDDNGDGVSGGGSIGAAIAAFRPPPYVGTLTRNNQGSVGSTYGVTFINSDPSGVSPVPTGLYILTIRAAPWKWGLWKYEITEVDLT